MPQALSQLGTSAGTILGARKRVRTGTSAWSHPSTMGQPHCRASKVLPMARIYFQSIQDQAIICTGQHDSSLYAVNDYTSLAVNFEYIQVGKGCKDDFLSFCLDSGVFPVAKQSCPLSSNLVHQSHTGNIFSATDKPLQLFAIPFSSLNI